MGGDRPAHDPEIPRYTQPEVRLLTLGVEYDVLGWHFDDLTDEQRAEVLVAHPRTNLTAGIIEACSAWMRDEPDATLGSMNAGILEATVPGYRRAHFCDFIRGSRFDS